MFFSLGEDNSPSLSFFCLLFFVKEKKRSPRSEALKATASALFCKFVQVGVGIDKGNMRSRPIIRSNRKTHERRVAAFKEKCMSVRQVERGGWYSDKQRVFLPSVAREPHVVRRKGNSQQQMCGERL